ncbi:hypothetical protein E2C01_022316 [Portunus trituberculatus]|uniref:Uncharacterized protein n=1 Tax=Portunus trituberculatus TaxID=210409 RepID=A0A5B7E5N9_PORTR|nr:hypothetical protein [Portunus trituberculatus]
MKVIENLYEDNEVKFRLGSVRWLEINVGMRQGCVVPTTVLHTPGGTDNKNQNIQQKCVNFLAYADGRQEGTRGGTTADYNSVQKRVAAKIQSMKVRSNSD